jgi:hypothetical protein
VAGGRTVQTAGANRTRRWSRGNSARRTRRHRPQPGVQSAGRRDRFGAFLLGTLLTWLRLRFDNLVGAWLFHALNNLLELFVALSLVPSLYAL